MTKDLSYAIVFYRRIIKMTMVIYFDKNIQEE